MEKSIPNLFLDRGDIVEQNRLVKIIPKLYKQFNLSFELKANGMNIDPTGYTSILQMGLGGDHATYGDRIPGKQILDWPRKKSYTGPDRISINRKNRF